MSACATVSGMVTAKSWDPGDVAVRVILCELRDENVETIRSLASKTGFSKTRVQSILSGDSSPATYGEVARLAAAFHVSPVSIIAEAEARLAAAAGENVEPVASPAPDINIERAG